MTVMVYAAIVVCGIVFVAAAVARAVWYARSPIHLRWELYPVPHERPDRVAHGGSYFEGSEWWLERRRPNIWGEIAVMVPEVLFLKALREFNPALWWRSFPFHFGLYLTACAGVGLVAMAAVAQLGGRAMAAGPLWDVVAVIVAVTGALGIVGAMLGALALLHRRITDATLRPYTTAGDVFNLLFFVVAFGALGGGYLVRPAGAPGALSIAIGLLSWDGGLHLSPLLAVGLVLTAALLAYIPLTHMSHFIGKYFTYHAVRWDDAPLGHDGKMAAELARYLTYRPTWAARHIKVNGASTWAEIVTTNPTREHKS